MSLSVGDCGMSKPLMNIVENSLVIMFLIVTN